MNRSNAEALSETDLIFAMDIGTRGVIGIVGILENQLFRVIDMEIREHEDRSVIDGQIEDIEKVSRMVRTIKERLEARLGIALKNVCVAAAGRALKTQLASFHFSVDPKAPFDQQLIFTLETGAVEEAKRLLNESNESIGDSIGYSCVGYSVIRYYLDGYPMKTLLNHKGKDAQVDLIATFLPGEVVESLNETMQRAGLRIGCLTLEPIAAMNVVIPQELRLLNLALVDVGAGTSDIAISNDGSVSAYAMVTVAGDEVTEAIAKELLLDFQEAEKLKFQISEDVSEIRYQNILGFEYTITPEALLAAIRPAIETLGAVIAEKILEINAKPPAAIFLVGGGSLTPGLADLVAGKLGIGCDKVAVGGGNHMKRSVVSDLPITGPEFATPLGIAVTAALNLGEDGFYVYVNEKKTRLFKRELVTVMDALLMSGYRNDQIIGRNGSSLTFTLNQQKKTLRGEPSTPAQIYLNHKPAAASTLVNIGDQITFTPAGQGKDAAFSAKDAIKAAGNCHVMYHGKMLPLRLAARVNGKPVKMKHVIANHDEIMVYSATTIAELCKSVGLEPSEHFMMINGELMDGKTRVRHGDTVDFLPISPASKHDKHPDIQKQPITSAQAQAQPQPQTTQTQQPPQKQVVAADQSNTSNFIGRKQISVPQQSSFVEQTENHLNPIGQASQGDNAIQIMLNQEPLHMARRKDGSPTLFLDLFSHLNIDTSNPKGKIVLRINGREASYLDELSDGDQIEIYWENTPVSHEIGIF